MTKSNLSRRHFNALVGAGLLGGIGFTMSIFIANLAFEGNTSSINAAKMAILVGSLAAGVLGFLWLHCSKRSDEVRPA